MKKILIVGILAFYSHVSNAQNSQEIASSYSDTATVTNNVTSLEERLNRHEQEVKEIKKNTELLKKEMQQLKSSFPNSNRKFSVNRRGSKQVIAE